MKKIYRLKMYVLTLFILVLSLCTLDYINTQILGKPDQKIWPIYHWALGFEKIPTFIHKGNAEVISCDSVSLKKPVSLENFVKTHGVEWAINFYKYSNRITFSNNKEVKTTNQKALEAQLLSRLPCNELTYSLIEVRKNLKTKEEFRKTIKILNYKKP